MSKIDPREFALAVVSANPVPGTDADDRAKKSLELYLAALKVAEEHIALEKDKSASRYLGG